jgi:hypothetical protein
LASAFAAGAGAGAGAGFGAISSWVAQDEIANNEAATSALMDNEFFI